MLYQMLDDDGEPHVKTEEDGASPNLLPVKTEDEDLDTVSLLARAGRSGKALTTLRFQMWNEDVVPNIKTEDDDDEDAADHLSVRARVEDNAGAGNAKPVVVSAAARNLMPMTGSHAFSCPQISMDPADEPIVEKKAEKRVSSVVRDVSQRLTSRARPGATASYSGRHCWPL